MDYDQCDPGHDMLIMRTVSAIEIITFRSRHSHCMRLSRGTVDSVGNGFLRSDQLAVPTMQSHAYHLQLSRRRDFRDAVPAQKCSQLGSHLMN
jgi:hypothetical protein